MINIILTELSGSVWENRDLGRVYGAFGLYSRPQSRFSSIDLLLG